MNETKLPLKKVAIRASDYFRPGGGGGDPTVFGAVTAEVRTQAARQVSSVREYFSAAFQAYPSAAAIARIALKEEALAKTHRPTRLLEDASCPIVGVGDLGDLLVSVRAQTLPRLESALLGASTKEAIANISTISVIEPFALEDSEVASLTAALSRNPAMSVKLKLFRHRLPLIDDELRKFLLKELRELGVHSKEINYGAGLCIFELKGVKPPHVERLKSFVGTQSLGRFPEFHVVKPAAQIVGKLTEAVFAPPDPGQDYPVVGLIDTGVSPLSAHLAPWVAGREIYVPPGDRDHEHGTFVAGLLVHARSLNHDDARFPDCPCRIIDVVAIPASGSIQEHELLAVVDEVVAKHPEVRVWNLSLAGSAPCSDHVFSDLAVALDEIQRNHDVTFVLAAGNYVSPPFREWPPLSNLGEADRICSPADSVHGLTVGSIAHRDSPTARVRTSSPSPFSRRGPGPAYLPKPEVAHFGGNCDSTGQHAQIGVLSIDAAGNLAESIGTSFASPVVAALLAHVQSRPLETLSKQMAKALIIHSAALANASLENTELPYRGFGVPQSVETVLGCDPWHATLLLELEIRAGEDLERAPFPIPACLQSLEGAFRGEMLVTLVYEPPLDSHFGAEYCRTNVSASLGTYRKGDYGRQVHPFPRQDKMSAVEKALVEHGFKWSPVKVYHRAMPRGVTGDSWRLVVDATDRSGATNETIRAALVITVSDLDRQARVYNDVVVAMNQLGWAHSDVQIRAPVRAA